MAIISEFQCYIVCFSLLLISSILFFRHLFNGPAKPTLRLPPSPPAIPFFGHLYLLITPVRLISTFMQNLSSKYGPLVYLRFGNRRMILVSSASYASEIFKTSDLYFSARPKPPFYEGLPLGNSGIFNAPYGDYWKFMRKLCMTELLGARQIERSHHVRREELKRFLHKLIEKGSKGEKVDIRNELMRLTNNTICRMAMSTRCSEKDDEAERCRELVVESIDLSGKLIAADALGPLKKMVYWLNRKQLEDVPRRLNELFERIMEEHEDNKVKEDGGERDDKDLMDILLKIFHDTNAEFKINRSQIKAFFLDLFHAGTDTTAGTMEWIMAELINHPDVFKKLRAEIDLVVGSNRLVEESDIPSLHYLQAVVKETMRLHSVVIAIIRECREDCKISGFDVPKETMMIVNSYSIMRDPEAWENPEEFLPERFLQESYKESNEKQNFRFVPFGGGRRICPGFQLAYITINIIIASMVQCFDWQVDGEVNLDAKSGMIMRLANPLSCLPVVHYNPFVVI